MFETISSFMSLRVLDKRLEPQVGTPVDSGSDTRNKKKIVTRPSLWGTLEFKFYYIMFILVLPMMYRAAKRCSSPENPNYEKYMPYLSPGWRVFGEYVDNSDPQYRFFRDNFTTIFILASIHIGSKRLAQKVAKCKTLNFDLIAGLSFLVGLHGVNSLRILTHAFIMFGIGKLGIKSVMVTTYLIWIYGIGSLFLNDRYRLFPFASLHPILSIVDDGFLGIVPRWDVFYNFTLLRLISYNLDYLASLEASKQDVTKYKKKDETPDLARDDKARMATSHDTADYNLKNYIAYSFYTPLYICGPIVTFNDYLYQTRNRLPSINSKSTVLYALRLVFVILTMEFILHHFHVVAISKAKAWSGDSPFEISMIGLLSLNVVWLKLLIPWRLFRLWALVDGIDTPENMIRCVNNNYSALAFWRAWHRSFNKWVVRYIYIPLGGSTNRIVTMLAVFSFVAIWHDIQLKMLLWGWLIVIFLLPEVLLGRYFVKFRDQWYYRHVCAFGCAINILLMMTANLFGFCLGSEGTKQLLADIFGTWSGIMFLVLVLGGLFIAVQIMFELREEEKRNGIDLRC